VSIEDDIAFFERVPTLRCSAARRCAFAIGAESRQRAARGAVSPPANHHRWLGHVRWRDRSGLDSDLVSIEDVVAGPNTLLGEFALIAATARPATATALEPSTVIRISRSLFLKMLEGYPEAAQILREHIAARVQQSQNEITNVRARLDASDAPR
jgi:CRP-like cAMP-binding protein